MNLSYLSANSRYSFDKFAISSFENKNVEFILCLSRELID